MYIFFILSFFQGKKLEYPMCILCWSHIIIICKPTHFLNGHLPLRAECEAKAEGWGTVAQWSEAQGYIINFITLKQTLNQEYSMNLKLTADDS